MIKVSKLICRPEAGALPHLAIDEISGVTVPVRDLDRAIAFYRRVFGFRAIRTDRSLPRRAVTLAGPGGALIALHEQASGAERIVPLHRRWGFVVAELDRVRELAWDLGVKVAGGNGEADHIRRWPNGRSLVVRDPDGNEIELVEEHRDRAAGLLRRHCPARRAWRRWRGQASCQAR
ncbi:MAG TPA: VOC family protein [Woeseiaceae bacterium]|nr:VOC family protein [Woeseiaceae bacterium]